MIRFISLIGAVFMLAWRLFAVLFFFAPAILLVVALGLFIAGIPALHTFLVGLLWMSGNIFSFYPIAKEV